MAGTTLPNDHVVPSPPDTSFWSDQVLEDDSSGKYEGRAAPTLAQLHLHLYLHSHLSFLLDPAPATLVRRDSCWTLE